MSIRYFVIIAALLLIVGCGGRESVTVNPTTLASVTKAQHLEAVFRVRNYTVSPFRPNDDDYPLSQLYVVFYDENDKPVREQCVPTEAEDTIECPLSGIKAGSRIVLLEPGWRGLCGFGWVEFLGNQKRVEVKSKPEEPPYPPYGCVFVLPVRPP